MRHRICPAFTAFSCAALLPAVLAGCDLTGTGPSGETVTETRPLTPFDAVDLAGVGDVTVVPGDDYDVTITTDAVFLDGVESEVVDGTLVLDEHYDFDTRDLDVDFVVTAPSVESVTLSGAGNITVEDVAGGPFDVNLDGAGNVTVSGNAKSAVLRLTGAGNVSARGLDAETAEVELSGAGNVTVTATETLTVSLSGVGNVTYYGGAEVQSTTTGVGFVNAG